MTNMTYGMLASGSCLLTDIAGRLNEPSKKINVVDRISAHFSKGIQSVLSYAKEGVRLLFKTKRSAYRQLCFKFIS